LTGGGRNNFFRGQGGGVYCREGGNRQRKKFPKPTRVRGGGDDSFPGGEEVL